MKKFYFTIIALTFGIAAQSQCVPPVITDVSGQTTICSGETATLSATTTAEEILWLDAATNGTELGSGNTFTSGPLTDTTSFWVQAQNSTLGTPISGGGKAAPTSTGGTTVVAVTSPWGLAFTANQDFIINSVDVFLSSSTPGNIVIQLKDAAYSLLETVTVAAPAGGTNANPLQFTVPLNLTVEGGNDYKLVVETGSPAMIRDLGSNGFPYSIGTVGTITAGTINDANTNTGVYYFLYNWNVTPINVCASIPQEVVVNVTVTPAPTGDANQLFVAGETIADLDVTGENLIWYSDSNATNQISTTTVLTEGTTYYVNQTSSGCTGPLLAVTASTTLSVNQQALLELSFLPNPVRSKLSLSASVEIDSVEVYSMNGQKLGFHKMNATSGVIDFSQYANGIYILRIVSGDAARHVKISKN